MFIVKLAKYVINHICFNVFGNVHFFINSLPIFVYSYYYSNSLFNNNNYILRAYVYKICIWIGFVCMKMLNCWTKVNLALLNTY